MASLIRKPNGNWQARIRKHKQTITKTFINKADAERWARQVEVEIDRGVYLNQNLAERTTFKELIERYMREVTPSMRGAKPDLIRLTAIARRPIAKLNVLSVTPQVISKYRDERLKEVANGTVIRELAYFSSIFNVARREWGFNVTNPVSMVKKPSSPQGRNRILNDSELNILLNALEPTRRKSIWMLPLVKLALETGMRRGELLGLHWNEINFNTRTAFIPLTKNGESRTVPLSSEAIRILHSIPRSINGQIFPIKHEVVSQAFNRGRQRAGVPDIHFHDLRHMAITRMAEKLPNLIELSAVSGHKSLAMLKRYYHPNPILLAEKLG